MFSAVAAAALTFILRSFSSEFHPWNRRAKTVMEKLRVTGLVVLVTCIVGLTLAVIGSAAVAIGLLPPLPIIPTPEQMLHVPTILLGTLVGSVVITSIVVFSFSAVVKIRTENLTAASAFTPLTTLRGADGRQCRRPDPDLRARTGAAALHGDRDRWRAADPLCGRPPLSDPRRRAFNCVGWVERQR